MEESNEMMSIIQPSCLNWMRRVKGITRLLIVPSTFLVTSRETIFTYHECEQEEIIKPAGQDYRV